MDNSKILDKKIDEFISSLDKDDVKLSVNLLDEVHLEQQSRISKTEIDKSDSNKQLFQIETKK